MSQVITAIGSIADAPVIGDSPRRLVIALGSDVLYDGEILPTLWWAFLALGSCVNLAVLGRRLLNMSRDPYERKMTRCAAVFVVACAVRSIWPRVDVERTCFWDSRISITLVGRVLATAAEVCFAAQFSMTIGMLAKEVNFSRTQRISDLFFWAICIAQCCCWIGVTTQRQVWHGIEESIWAVTFTGVAVSLAVLLRTVNRAAPRSNSCCSVCAPGDAGYVRRCVTLGIPTSIAYVLFMVLVDVPMYMGRFHADQARGARYLWVSEGLRSAMTCNKVSKSMADWAPEMPWMTAYFLGATAISLWLSFGPALRRDAREKCT